MKRLFTFCFTFILLFSLVPAAVVAQEETISVILDGKTLSFDVPPMLVNDRTMVPMRAIFTALGAEVDWDEESQTAISVRDGVTIRIQIGSAQMEADGVAVPLDAPAMLVNDRTLVPLRAVSEAFGVSVDWQGDTNTVLLNSPTPTSTPPTPTPTATAVSTPTPENTATPSTTPQPTATTEIPVLPDDTLPEEDTAFVNAALAYYMDLGNAYDAMREAFSGVSTGHTKELYQMVVDARKNLSAQTYQTYTACAKKTSLTILRRAMNETEAQTKELLGDLRLHLSTIGNGRLPTDAPFDYRRDFSALIKTLEELEALFSLYDISGDYSSVRTAAEQCMEAAWIPSDWGKVNPLLHGQWQ